MEMSMLFLGTSELVIILIILLVLFGGSQIPKVMKGLGKGIGEFKKGVKEEDEEPITKDDSDKQDK